MKIISIHDHENARAIVAQVPAYLTDISDNDEGIAEAIFDALGISSSNSNWIMLGDSGGAVCIDLDIFNSSAHKNGYIRLEELTQDFRTDALAALEEINAV